MRSFPQVPPVIRIGGMSSKAPYQFSLASVDSAGALPGRAVVEEKIRAIPGLTDVTTDLLLNSPQVFVKDRPRQGRHARDHRRADRLRALQRLRQPRSLEHLHSADEYSVILEVRRSSRKRPSASPRCTCAPPRAISCRSMPSLRSSTPPGPLTVNHLGQLPAVTVSFNTLPGVSLGDAVNRIEAAVKECVPPGQHSLPRRRPRLPDSLGNLGLLLIMAVLVIYLVLGILYESFIHPLTILSGLPPRESARWSRSCSLAKTSASMASSASSCSSAS
jgi:multidrug efflux pump subunit AcrB